MSKYTSRIEEEDGAIVAWIDRDGYQMIRQPHHPNALNNESWSSKEEAQTWADSAITQIESDEAKQIQQQADQEALLAQAKIDSQKIAEMHDIIKALEAKLA